MKKLLSVLSIVFLLSGCTQSLDYKYADKPMLVSCEGANAKLLNEALYSFFDDITNYYRKKDFPQNEGMSTAEAYAYYIYTGAIGDADYKGIVSEHTIKIIEQLKKEKELWNLNGRYSNLNHRSKFVNCLFSNIKKEELRTTLLSLQEINNVSPKLLAERFRISTRDALEDSNYGMYIALDTYYQYLINLEL